MNKFFKKKLIVSIILLIVGTVILLYSILDYKILSKDLRSYISGLGGGCLGVGIYTLVMYVKASKNPKKAKEIENELKDERIKSNNNYAMAISFKVSVITEAIISIICAFSNQMEIAKYMGFAVFFQLLLYLILYFVTNKKI